MTLPISAVVATCNRGESLHRTLQSLAQQTTQPKEIVVIDASDDPLTDLTDGRAELKPEIVWVPARQAGAATQRNQGVALATQPFVWFFDDDILFEPDCLQRLWNTIGPDRQLGGVNAMIVNQRYQTPGLVSRAMFTLMHGKSEKSFAGRVIGPAINLLPEDREDLPGVVPVEWLNTTCTIYRREALPSPPFDSFFTGYSLMEDLALSLRVAREWKLANVRTARIRHESQAGAHKQSARDLASMELGNRHYVMSSILERRRLTDYLRLALWEVVQLAVLLLRPNLRNRFWADCLGKIDALKLMRTRRFN